MPSWSVSRASRVGRNHIKLELFKLYEGTPSEVVASSIATLAET